MLFDLYGELLSDNASVVLLFFYQNLWTKFFFHFRAVKHAQLPEQLKNSHYRHYLTNKSLQLLKHSAFPTILDP